ncbi:MAG: hypothetical protein AAF918_10455 [Pseudomonadota bacterium]
MMLYSGEWFGKGTLLAIDSTRSQPLRLEATVTTDDSGVIVQGRLDMPGFGEQRLTLRAAADETGRYQIDCQLGSGTFLGNAKLESEPNMGMIWTEPGIEPAVTASFVLFEIHDKLGCRGFLRSGSSTLTWELALTTDAEPVRADDDEAPASQEPDRSNVVPLRRR